MKLSTARNIIVFMTDSSDHITGKAGLTLTITASKDGAAFASISPTVTDLSNGWYNLALTTTHTNTLGDLALNITGTGADLNPIRLEVTPDIIGSLSAGAVQSIWDALSASLSTANSIGKRIVDFLTGDVYARVGAPAGASLAVDVAAVKTDSAAIKAKTDNLPSDPADASDIAGSFSTVNSTLSTIASYIDTEVAAIKAKTDNLPATPASQGDVTSVGSNVTAIKAKTDNLPSDPADASDIAAAFSTVNSTLGTIAGYIDTEVAAIKAKTDNLPATPASQGDVTSVGSNVTAIKAKTDNLPSDPADASDIAASVAAIIAAINSSGVPKNVDFPNFTFPMVDTSGAPLTGLTVAARRSIDGGAFALCANAVVEIGRGKYKIALAAADLNGDEVALEFSATDAANTEWTIFTI